VRIGVRVMSVGLFVWLLGAGVTLASTMPAPPRGGAVPADRATVPPTNTPRHVNTPRPPTTPTPTSTPTLIPGRLCTDCSRVRLRATPGTMGDVLEFLGGSTELLIMGRTANNAWLQVSVGGVEGWVSAQFVRLPNFLPIDSDTLSGLPVTGVPVEAPPTPTLSADNIGNLTWLSGVTAHARQIFAVGQRLGNRADVFSRVGDSISASSYFLTPIGYGQYDLGEYGYLSGVIAFFSQANARAGNSFVNPPLAARGGWSAYNLLDPNSSSKPDCGYETPLVCEYKLVKPAVALIMVGTNDSGSGSPDQFAGNLHQIVQTSIDMGVIPVLSTIPPKRINADQTARVEAFNSVIRATAQQYDVPLWDYWAVMESAPNEGMSADGMHPSVPPDGATGRFSGENLQYGYTLRNLTALQTLNVLWRQVLY
jgi:hypothetical protein